MDKGTNFRFGVHALTDSRDENLDFLRKGVWIGLCDTLNFWPSNANSSGTSNATEKVYGNI